MPAPRRRCCMALRDEVGEAVVRFDARTAGLIAGSFMPAAVVGLAFERPIERRLGGPGSIAAGLVLGSVVMAVGGPPRRIVAPPRGRRTWPTRCGWAWRRRAR